MYNNDVLVIYKTDVSVCTITMYRYVQKRCIGMYKNDVSVCTITMSVHNDDLVIVYIRTTCLCLCLCQRVDVDVIPFKIQFNQGC
jgi:hypothetical protein